MKKRIHFLFTVVYLLFALIACNNKCNVDDIEVSEILALSSKEKGIKYCKLLEAALTGDKKAILDLSLLEFSDATGYDHGSILVDLIIKIGEDKYIGAISTTNKQQKGIIKSYIDVGLEYGNNNLIKNKDMKDSFLHLYLVLK